MPIITPNQFWQEETDRSFIGRQDLVDLKNQLIDKINHCLRDGMVVYRSVEVEIPQGTPEVVVSAIRKEIGCAGYYVFDSESPGQSSRTVWSVTCKR